MDVEWNFFFSLMSSEYKTIGRKRQFPHLFYTCISTIHSYMLCQYCLCKIRIAKCYILRKYMDYFTVQALQFMLNNWQKCLNGIDLQGEPSAVCHLAGMEFMGFFLASPVVLCFRFVSKTGVVRHQGFSCCWTVLAQHWGLLCFTLCHPSEKLGVCRELKGDTAKQMTSADQHDAPHHKTLSPLTLHLSCGKTVPPDLLSPTGHCAPLLRKHILVSHVMGDDGPHDSNKG